MDINDPSVISTTTLSFPTRSPVNTSAVSQADSVTTKPEVQKDPNLSTVFLPSAFHFYDWKEISLRPIRGIHQSKFARAAREQSNQHMADAISSLLPDDRSSYELTIPDYYWIMYYLRLNNYTKTPMVHRAVCTNPEHVLQVSRGELERETLITVTPISKTTLKDVQFDPKTLQVLNSSPFLKELTEAGYELSPFRVSDMLEMEKMQDVVSSIPKDRQENAKKELEDIEYLADYAAFIRPVGSAQIPLLERVHAVENFSPDLLSLISDYNGLIRSYGVEEKIKTNCGKCGATIETEVSIAAHSFL